MPKYALLVSVDYEGIQKNLPGRECNIGMMRDICSQLDFDLVNIKILFDKELTEFKSIYATWTSLIKKGKSSDTFLFYYHGHGISGLISCRDGDFDPSELKLAPNDYTNVTAIFDTCNAGTTETTGIHSIHNAALYIASSFLDTYSYATYNGSILTLALFSYINWCTKQRIWPTNSMVIEAINRNVICFNVKYNTRNNFPNCKTSDYYVGISLFLEPPKLNNSDSINAGSQDRFFVNIELINPLYGGNQKYVFDPYNLFQ